MLQILTMFLKPSLKELKFHMGNISQQKISENKNCSKNNMRRIDFFDSFDVRKNDEKVDPTQMGFEQILFSEICFSEIFTI